MKKCIIVAKSQNNVIGDGKGLLWHISEDLKHFKDITMGYPVIMGRKTYESIGKPLPGRTNIVITKQDLEIPGAIVVHSLDEAYKVAERKAKRMPKIKDKPIPTYYDIKADDGEKRCFVIGGGSIYEQAMERGDISELYITVVYKDFDGNTKFPEIDTDEWFIRRHTVKKVDEETGLEYRFIRMEPLTDEAEDKYIRLI